MSESEIQTKFMSPEERLRALETLEQRQKRNQKVAISAAWGSVVLGVVVLVGLIGFGRSQLGTLSAQKRALEGDIQDLQAKKREAVNLANTLSNSLPEAQTASAVESTLSSTKATKALLPRVYMQILAETDRERAMEIRGALQNSGYLVLGIELVPNGAPQKTSDVRYYHAGDQAEAVRIADAVKKAAGIPVNLSYLSRFENSTRPNHFEVWIAPRT